MIDIEACRLSYVDPKSAFVVKDESMMCAISSGKARKAVCRVRFTSKTFKKTAIYSDIRC